MKTREQTGFTLIELMIVIAIIGLIAAIAYPSYQQYVVKTKRTDMMSEMQNIASEIQNRKLGQGTYAGVVVTDLIGNYPRQGNALYSVSSTSTPLTSTWEIIATPIPRTQMIEDGPLSLNYQGIKCRGIAPNQKCGSGDEWNK